MVSEVKTWGRHSFCYWECHCSKVLSADRGRKCKRMCTYVCLYYICMWMYTYTETFTHFRNPDCTSIPSIPIHPLKVLSCLLQCQNRMLKDLSWLLCRQCTQGWASVEAGMPVGRYCSSSRNKGWWLGQEWQWWKSWGTVTLLFLRFRLYGKDKICCVRKRERPYITSRDLIWALGLTQLAEFSVELIWHLKKKRAPFQ